MRLFILASVFFCSTAAYAAPARTDTDADAAARKSKAGAKLTEYDFENDNVSGDALSPDHQPVRSLTTTTHESMIRLRVHFIPQMLQMANDV